MNVEENFLYTPVTFVYTRTIGEKVQEQQKDLYIWRYTDIVKVSRTYPYLYYLFHIAPIYNWMRPNLPACFELQQLTQYLKQSPPSIISPLSLQQIRENILSYGEKWQVVKLCAKAQIRIDSSFKSCPHLLKTKQWSSLYNYDFQERKLYCQMFYCGKCEATHRAAITILTYPFAPIFSAYYGDAITDTSQKDQKGNFVTYRLAIVYDNQSTFYIYGANQIWYQVKGNQISMKKYEFKKSKGGLFVYVKTTCFENLGLIRQAEILNKSKEELKNIRIASPEIIDESEQNMQAKKQTETFSRKKTDQPARKKSNKKLRSLQKKSQSIIVPEEGYKSYKMEIEKLFHKPKQKDEYEKQYDKGKTKKIKKKGDYFKPDFNQVYKDLKKQTKEQKEIFPRKRTNMPHRRPNKLNKTNNSEIFRKNQRRKWEKRVHK